MYKDVGHYLDDNAIEDKCYPNSIFCLDTRLIRKILKIMNIGCCCIGEDGNYCGWHEGTCDFHHINGRKIKNANTEFNISLICPNHHRLVHEDKIKKENLIPLSKLIKKKWKNLIHIYWEDNKVYYILKRDLKDDIDLDNKEED